MFRWPSRVLAVGTLIALATLTACAAPGDPGAEPSPGDDATSEFDPETLIGQWSVAEAADEAATSVIQFDTELTLWRECGALHLGFLVDHTGTLLTDLVGGSGTCFTADDGGFEDAVPAWLASANRIESDGADLILRDELGNSQARLSPGGTPPPSDDIAQSELEPLEATPELRAHLAGYTIDLPDSLQAPTADDLIEGRWLPTVPDQENPTGSWIDFSSDNTWQGSDGCNQTGGLWLLGAQGQLRTTSGPMTLMACPGVAVGSWIAQAAAIGLDTTGASTELVILDRTSIEIGRLTLAAG